MPLNEASRKPSRERWPLAFDLEGVPNDSGQRQKLLLDLKEETMPPVQNNFAVDKPVQEITDINNPPHKNYNPHDPKNQYPKMLYHHESGRVLTVNDTKEEKAALKRSFDPKPAPGRDYSKVSRAGIAAPAATGPKREEEMSAEELAAMDEEEGS